MKKYLLTALCAATLAAAALGTTGLSAAQAETAATKSAYVQDIRILSEIETPEQLATLSVSDTSIAIVRVGQDGKLTLGETSVAFEPSAFGKAVPAFCVTNAAEAEAAATLIAEYAPYAFILSENPALVSSVREQYTTANGMLDYRNVQKDALSIRNDVNSNRAKSVIVSAGALSRQEILTLKKLLVTVYVAAEGREQIVTSLTDGADGLLADPAAVAEGLTVGGGSSKIVAPRPLIVAHRGNSQAKRGLYGSYYENTVEAARAAYENYRPDFVEIDLYLSKDGSVVISHDASLNRMTTGTGNIESMTLAQIRQYKVDGGLGESAEYLDEIPILNDYFEEFRDTDLFFLLEIKSAKPECVDAALNIIGKYKMEGRVNFISFDRAQLEYAQSVNPRVSVSYLTNGNEFEAGTPSFAYDVMDTINPINASLSPNWENLNADAVNELNRFGVKVNAWTLNMEAAFFRELRNIGYSTLTTDFCNWMEKLPYEIRCASTKITAKPGEAFTLGGEVIGWNQKVLADAEIEVILLSDAELARDGDKYVIDEEGTVVFILAYHGKTHTIFSEPITVNVSQKAESGGGCSSSLVSPTAASIVLLCGAATVLLTVRKKG